MSWMDSLGSAAKPGKNLDPEERKKISKDLVTMSSFGAAAVTLAPIPGSDFILVTSVQASMVAAVGRVFGRELTVAQAKDVVVELAAVCGLGLIAQKGFATLTKILLPGLGGVLAAPYAFAVTYGMGHAAMSYFENQDFTKETIKRVYEEAMAEGKRIFSRETFAQFRRRRARRWRTSPASRPKVARRRTPPRRLRRGRGRPPAPPRRRRSARRPGAPRASRPPRSRTPARSGRSGPCNSGTTRRGRGPGPRGGWGAPSRRRSPPSSSSS